MFINRATGKDAFEVVEAGISASGNLGHVGQFGQLAGEFAQLLLDLLALGGGDLGFLIEAQSRCRRHIHRLQMVPELGDLLVQFGLAALQLRAGVVIMARQAGNFLGNILLQQSIILEFKQISLDEAQDMLFDQVGRQLVALRAALVVAFMVSGANVIARLVSLAAGGSLPREPAAANAADKAACQKVVAVNGGPRGAAVGFLGCLAAGLHRIEGGLVNKRRPGVGFDDPIGFRAQLQAFVQSLHALPALAANMAVPFALGALVVDARAGVGGIFKHGMERGNGEDGPAKGPQPRLVEIVPQYANRNPRRIVSEHLLHGPHANGIREREGAEFIFRLGVALACGNHFKQFSRL